MNPEPLKGKIEKMYCSPRDSKRYMEGFLKINVKSAVEWLKEKVKEGVNRKEDSFGHKNLTTEGVLDWIEKAFEDVIKK